MEMIEILLDNVDKDATIQFLHVIIASSKGVTSINSSLDIEINNDLFLLKNIFDKAKSNYVYISLENVNLCNIDFKYLELYFLVYKNANELTISIEKSELFSYSMSKMMSCSYKISSLLKTNLFYCGYEPAKDVDTQFFSHTGYGKLKWD